MTDAKKGMPTQLEYFTRKAALYEAKARENPDDVTMQFFARAFAGYKAGAQKKASTVQSELVNELIDFRFLGPRADHGAMRLGDFLAVMEPLNSALNRAAYRLRNGVEAWRGVGDEIRDSLNLQMAGLAVGSTRVLITGDGRADLTGMSLLHNTLKHTFNLLNARQDEFLDAVDAVGGLSAKSFGQALKKTARFGLAARFTWRHDGGHRVWEGSPLEIDRVIALIASNSEPEVYEQVLQGTVASIADNGVIYIRQGADKDRVKIRFPMKASMEAEKLRMKMSVALKVKTSVYQDTVLKKDVFKHTLISTL